jgi:UDP-N-acetylglucosamine 2-epimerase (non-hydrolysing)
MISLVLGTRPEIVKMSPVIRALDEADADYFIIHTGQHYSGNMNAVFFKELRIKKPRYNIGAGSGSHGQETSRMLMGVEDVLIRKEPDMLLVQGDTNSVLAGAIAASKLGIPVGHVEAGLRSYYQIPEETNRIVADHVSDLLFAPTAHSKKILLSEGLESKDVFVTGNTVVDAIFQNRENMSKSRILKRLGLTEGGYILVTFHRVENVDDPRRFAWILSQLDAVGKRFNLPILYPIHPRSRKRMKSHGLDKGGVRLIDPVGFFDFLKLLSSSSLVITDSGGVQEESCTLKVPCITLRENTERPESIAVGANMLVRGKASITAAVGRMMSSRRDWRNPFGDGKAGKRIVSITLDRLKSSA